MGRWRLSRAPAGAISVIDLVLTPGKLADITALLEEHPRGARRGDPVHRGGPHHRRCAGHGSTVIRSVCEQPVVKVATAFDRRYVPSAGVVPRSNTAGMLPRHALSAGRIAGLGATWDFYHGLLARPWADGDRWGLDRPKSPRNREHWIAIQSERCEWRFSRFDVHMCEMDESLSSQLGKRLEPIECEQEIKCGGVCWIRPVEDLEVDRRP